MNINPSPSANVLKATPTPGEPVSGPKGPSRGGRSPLETLGDAVVETGAFFYNETSLLALNDPAFVLSRVAPEARDVFVKVSSAPTQLSADGLSPAINDSWWATGTRLAMLGVNSYSLVNSIKDPETHWFRKGADGLRVATDLLGVAGAVMQAALPKYAGLGGSLLGIAVTADACSSGIRLMDHANSRRVKFQQWNDARKARQREKTTS